MTMPHAVLGTPEYMSPEQARGDEQIDHRTDLYSAGVVLYEMLTGRTPFRADAPTATIHQILHDDPPDPRKLDKSVDPALASLGLRLMAKRPEDRFPSAGEVLEALEAGERVPSLAHGRRTRRRGVSALVGFVLIGLLGWQTLLWVFNLPKITRVEVDGRMPTRILVERGYGRGWEELSTFLPVVESVEEVRFLDLDEEGNQAVFAGVNRPLDGHNLFAFDARGNEIWRQSVSNHPLVKQWPDCGDVIHWPCRILRVGNLGGKLGNALVVSANDAGYYPTRISVINLPNGSVISTFWHMGQFTDLWILPDFLGPGSPAILGRGSNNKLDGFDEPLDADGEPYTGCDVVDIMVVLDPSNMDGLGPPRTDPSRVPIKAVTPYAYAFLQQPQIVANATHIREGQTEANRSMVPGALCIRDITRSHAESPDAEPVLRISVGRQGESGPIHGGWIFTLDRNLELTHVRPVDGETVRPSQAY